MGQRGPIMSREGVRGQKRIAATGSMGEPKPRPIIPKCPKYLGATSRKEWKRIVPELDRLGLLTCVDGAVLETYCVAYGNMVEAQKVIEKHGLTFITETGYVGQRPEVSIVNKSQQVIRSFIAELGLSPAARARMAMPDKPDAADPMESLLSGK